MINENKILFYSEELNEDVNQNNNLLNSKEVLIQNNNANTINSNSYSSIVDSIDYLGCINGNCSKIKCDCNSMNCNCEQTGSNSNNHSHSSHNSSTNSSTNSTNNNSNNFLSNLIDFLYAMFVIVFLIYILYNRNSQHLIYVLGITIIYIFYKIYIISS
jgi:preprotein translocase subunit SecG